MSLNVVNLVGRAGKNPEIIHFQSGAIKTTVDIAVNRRQRNSSPDWVTLECWSKTAEIMGDYVSKGKLIGVQGSLKIDTWIDPYSGGQRSRPVIVVERLHLLGGGRNDQP